MYRNCIALLLAVSLTVGCRGQLHPVTATYLANEGVLIETGQSKVLIDPFFKEDFGLYQILPIENIDRLLKDHRELAGADAILVSHNHRDHFDAGLVTEYLKQNRHTKLFSSSQVTSGIINHFGLPLNRVVNFLPAMNKEIVSYNQGSIKLKALWIRHGVESNLGVVNLCFIVEVSQKKIFHMGDSEIDADNFKDIDLSNEGIDMLLAPFWYLASEEGASIIKQKVKPKQVAAFHLTKDFAKYKPDILRNFPEAIFMDEPFRKFVIND